MIKYTESEINNKLLDIQNYNDLLENELDKYPQDMWKYKHSPDKWSIHEIVIHIVECQIYIFTMFRSILATPKRNVPNWDEEIWTKELNYHEEIIDDWLTVFKDINNIMLQKLKKITYNKWIEEFQLQQDDKKFDITLCDWLRYNCSHVEDHIKHMSDIYDLWVRNSG
jgi:hypothetical protein